jgi:hypothetical protein
LRRVLEFAKRLLAMVLAAVAWYYSWSFYVESLPHSSAYYDSTHNPIPDSCVEKTFQATAGFRGFAEAAIVAVPAPFEEVWSRVQEAIRGLVATWTDVVGIAASSR